MSKKEQSQSKVSEEFIIEDGVPMPASRSRYPFGALGVGQSFTTSKLSVQAAACTWAKKHGCKLATHRDKASGEVRVWRVS
jgi:hypothetical protein